MDNLVTKVQLVITNQHGCMVIGILSPLAINIWLYMYAVRHLMLLMHIEECTSKHVESLNNQCVAKTSTIVDGG